MDRLGFLLLVILCKGLAGKLPFYSPGNDLFVEEDGTAVVSSNTNLPLDRGSAITWFRHKHKMEEPPKVVIECLTETILTKYECDYAGRSAKLKIYDVQNDDSGIYFCVVLYRGIAIITEWTRLIVRHKPASSGSVYLLTPTFYNNASSQLVCVAQNTPHWIKIRWNISGEYYIGRIRSKISKIDGSWTFLNCISIPRDSWDQTVACEVWFGSSFVSLTWNNSQKVPTLKPMIMYLEMCSFYVRSVLVVCILLVLIICVHLSYTYI